MNIVVQKTITFSNHIYIQSWVHITGGNWPLNLRESRRLVPVAATAQDKILRYLDALSLFADACS